MKIVDTSISDVKIIKRNLFYDNRGCFSECFRASDFTPRVFVQGNTSRSKKGVIRGLHYQIVQPQAKLVTVMSGCILDIAVDIRKGSPTAGQYVSVFLDEDGDEQLFIPEGFAHGFQALEDNTVVHYECSDYFNAEGSRGIRYDDPWIGAWWVNLEGVSPILSDKDQAYPSLRDAEKPYFNKTSRI